MSVPTPELNKLKQQRELLHTEAIGQFLEWCAEQGWELCFWQHHVDGEPCPHAGTALSTLDGAEQVDGTYRCPGCGATGESRYFGEHVWQHEWATEPIGEGRFPVNKRIEQILAEYAGVDLDKVDAEKKALIEHMRAQHAAGTS